jgi:hypothetical protein
MNITNAQYFTEFGGSENVGIKATLDDHEIMVPLQSGNIHYDEIMKQVASGELTIADAE